MRPPSCKSSALCVSRAPITPQWLAVSIANAWTTVEMTAQHWMQFTIGRDVAYFAVGLVENAVPSYNAETSPAATRGLLSGSIMLLTTLGNLWGAGMSRAYATTSTKEGWLIPTGMQFIPAVAMLALVPLTPESPRWLLLKGRYEAAKTALNKIRHQHEVDDGSTEAELKAMNDLVQESLATEEGSWLDLFKGNYLRRTWICGTLFAIHQSNGNQFVQSYAATFYVQQGLGAMSFTYTMIGQAIAVVGCAAGIVLFDITGRRPLLVYGSCICAFLLFLASGIGSVNDPNQSQTHTMISCFMILPAFTRIAASNTAFLTGAEIGGVRMRKKIMVCLSLHIVSASIRSCDISVESVLTKPVASRHSVSASTSLLPFSSHSLRPMCCPAWACVSAGYSDPCASSLSFGDGSSFRSSRYALSFPHSSNTDGSAASLGGKSYSNTTSTSRCQCKSFSECRFALRDLLS